MSPDFSELRIWFYRKGQYKMFMFKIIDNNAPS